MSHESPHEACGCCGGVTVLTPVDGENRPALSALAFRAGTHARFKASMLARLSTRKKLGELTTRDDSDPTVALLDAWATTLDVLTFYQERIANEGYLRTATERQSILELARTIGYELSPGVAASTWLAFTADDSPGSPREVAIPAGTRAQSVPVKSEPPQSFETAAEVLARPEWNALKPALTEPQKIEAGDREALLAGAALDLKPGDALLWRSGREAWDFRILLTAEAQPESGLTRVTWAEPLAKVAAAGLRVFALRQRASLFGHNAPDWNALPDDIRKKYATSPDSFTDWPGIEFNGGTSLSLDTEYPRIVAGSWLVLDQTAAPGPLLFEVRGTSTTSSPRFALSVKRTRLAVDPPISNEVSPREAAVFAQSEELFLAEKPVSRSLAGALVKLDRQVEGLTAGRTVIVRGRRARAVVGPEPLTLKIVGGGTRPLRPAETLTVLAVPVVKGRFQVWQLLDDDGIEGSVQVPLAPGKSPRPKIVPDLQPDLIRAREAVALAPTRKLVRFDVVDAFLPDVFINPRVPGDRRPPKGGGKTIPPRPERDIDVPPRPEEIPPSALALAPAREDDPVVAEVAVLDEVLLDNGRTMLVLEKPLAHIYDPATVTVHANVAKATHGETKREVLGSGDAAQPFQWFRLRQKPLTYVSAPVPGGGASTLELRVNGVLWHEAPNLAWLGPRDRSYVLRRDDEGSTTVHFGDGVHGARPASGIENVEAVYRVGIGSAGAVGEDRISLLPVRPLGVRSVVNPLAATGAADPEERDQARRNAPRTVLTLDRVVSLRDFEDYARGFAGIGKAQARLLWKRGLRTVHLTVAAADGQPVSRDAELFRNLVASLEGARDPYQTLEVASFEPVHFRVRARVGIHPDHRKEDVLARAETAMRQAFSFDVRDFGQGVSLSDVMAGLQGVDGIEGVDVEALHRISAAPSLEPRLFALPARLDEDGEAQPGQILLLAPEPVSLEVLR